METQDHKKAASHSGHEGHHVCHKCGWPFPNPHPSARHRRAHKRVCGTIDGYTLDNNTPHLEGSDGEHVSDDDHKTPSGKVVERTISRRSSSGVGSRSSRSTRSEDDVFADAVTEFTDSPAVSRENSLQNVIENEPDHDKLAVENAIADNLSASNIGLDGKQLQAIQAPEDENEKVEAVSLSHDPISGSNDSPAPVYASVPNESENASEQNMMQASRTFSESDVVAEEAEEIVSCKDHPEHGTQCNETGEVVCEDVPIQRGASEEPNYSVPAGEMGQNTGLQTLGSEFRAEFSHGADSSGNSHVLLHSVQVVEAANEGTSKSLNLLEEHGSPIEANENAFVLAIPESLSIHENLEMPVHELDLTGGKINASVAPNTTLAVEKVEYGEPHAVEERSSSTDFAKYGESNNVCSLDDVHVDAHSKEDMLGQELKSLEQKKCIVEHNTVGEQEQISDVKTSNADISKLMSEEVLEIKDEKESRSDRQKSNDLLVDPEEATVGCGDIDANACYSVNDDTKHLVIHNSDVSKVSVQEPAATNSTLVQPAVCGIAPHLEELVDVHERADKGCDDKARVEGTALNDNEVRIGGEAENKPMSAETASDFGLTMTGSDDKNDDLFELERNHDHDTVSDSGKAMVVHSQLESPVTSPCVREMPTDDHLDSNSTTGEDAGCSFLNSAAVVDSSSEKLEDNASDFNEGVDRMIKQHASASAVDAGDSGSQTDSLEGNWGSVSVLSAVSDALPVTDTAATNNTEPSSEAGNVSLDPKAVGEAQQSESKTSVEPHVDLKQWESASEIQNHHQQSSDLQSGWSSSVSTAGDELGGGRMVNDWSDGKQHTALKTLLGEAIAKSRAESPNNNESGSMSHMDEIPAANNGFPAKTEKSGFKAAKEEMGKEWNSPAKYPVNIKTEKRRAKSRPYWAPFLCSSVNAR